MTSRQLIGSTALLPARQAARGFAAGFLGGGGFGLGEAFGKAQPANARFVGRVCAAGFCFLEGIGGAQQMGPSQDRAGHGNDLSGTRMGPEGDLFGTPFGPPFCTQAGEKYANFPDIRRNPVRGDQACSRKGVRRWERHVGDGQFCKAAASSVNGGSACHLAVAGQTDLNRTIGSRTGLRVAVLAERGTTVVGDHGGETTQFSRAILGNLADGRTQHWLASTCIKSTVPAMDEFQTRSYPARGGTQMRSARGVKTMGPSRFELPTSSLSGTRSNQLSYEPAKARFVPCWGTGIVEKHPVGSREVRVRICGRAWQYFVRGGGRSGAALRPVAGLGPEAKATEGGSGRMGMPPRKVTMPLVGRRWNDLEVI